MPEDPYVYPATSVLRNRFGVRDASELARRERDASSAEILALLDHRCPDGHKPRPSRTRRFFE